jgi:hypothetical protein
LRASVIEKRIRHRLGQRFRTEHRERVRHPFSVAAASYGARLRRLLRVARERCANAHGYDD